MHGESCPVCAEREVTAAVQAGICDCRCTHAASTPERGASPGMKDRRRDQVSTYPQAKTRP